MIPRDAGRTGCRAQVRRRPWQVLRGLGYAEDAMPEHLGDDAFGGDRKEAPVAERRLPPTPLGTAIETLFLQLPVGADGGAASVWPQGSRRPGSDRARVDRARLCPRRARAPGRRPTRRRRRRSGRRRRRPARLRRALHADVEDLRPAHAAPLRRPRARRRHRQRRAGAARCTPRRPRRRNGRQRARTRIRTAERLAQRPRQHRLPHRQPVRAGRTTSAST